MYAVMYFFTSKVANYYYLTPKMMFKSGQIGAKLIISELLVPGSLKYQIMVLNKHFISI